MGNRKKDKSDYLRENEEWIEYQYNPVHYTGGKINPALTRTSFASGMLFLGIGVFGFLAFDSILAIGLYHDLKIISFIENPQKHFWEFVLAFLLLNGVSFAHLFIGIKKLRMYKKTHPKPFKTKIKKVGKWLGITASVIVGCIFLYTVVLQINTSLEVNIDDICLNTFDSDNGVSYSIEIYNKTVIRIKQEEFTQIEDMIRNARSVDANHNYKIVYRHSIFVRSRGWLVNITEI